MKTKHAALTLILLAVSAVTGCAWMQQHQSQIQTAEKTIATAAQVAAPFVSNKKISDDLYAVAAVANAYGSEPVPTNILQATTQLPQVAGVVLPLVTGRQNSAQTVKILDGAAQILASLGGSAPPAAQ